MPDGLDKEGGNGTVLSPKDAVLGGGAGAQHGEEGTGGSKEATGCGGGAVS